MRYKHTRKKDSIDTIREREHSDRQTDRDKVSFDLDRYAIARHSDKDRSVLGRLRDAPLYGDREI